MKCIRSVSILVLCSLWFLPSAVFSDAQLSATTPQKVTQLEVTEKNTQSISLEWKNQPKADHYQIRVTKRNGTLVKKVWTTNPTKTIKKLHSDTKYVIRVRALIGKKSNKHFGPYSTAVNAKTKKILFGFWGMNGYISESGLADVADRFSSTIFQVASSSPNYTVHFLLPLVRSSGFKVTLRMTEDHDSYTTNEDFDLDKWKVQVALWEDSGVQEFIDDGTLAGHMLLDDIDTFTGTDPTAADLDEMARYSKEVLPGLMTFVRQKCSNVPEPQTDTGTYRFLDDCVNQYTNYSGFSDGPIATYVTEQKVAAKQLSLGFINGLNIADGGDGSSDQPGASTGKYAMSAAEITEYGEALLTAADLDMFLLWEYDSQQEWSDGSTGTSYFDQPEIQAALKALAESTIKL